MLDFQEVERSLDFRQPAAVPRRPARANERAVRAPVQERARRRRESFLDATERLLARSGLDAITTNAVAAEAGASIGTLYEYFPDRAALLSALLERYGERLHARIDEALTSAGDDWQSACDTVVDAFARFWMDEPGYRPLWLATLSASSDTAALLASTGERWGDAFTTRVAKVIARFAPALRPAERRLTARIVVHLVSSLLFVAMQGPASRRRATIDETKLALRAYLVARITGAR